MTPHRLPGAAALLTTICIAGCVSPSAPPDDSGDRSATGAGAAQPALATPTTAAPTSAAGPVSSLLSVREGWEARAWLDQGTVGVWTVQCLDVVPDYAGPEVVAVDDKGRLHILFTYSGRMYSWQVVEDREWLGGVWLADVDPAIPGPELYTGGRRGNLYQIVWKPWAAFSVVSPCHVNGELNNVVAADFEPSRPGLELIGFLHPRGIVRFRPENQFAPEEVNADAIRLRDAAVFRDGDRDSAMVASRDGTLGVLRAGNDGKYAIDVIARRSNGFGRVTKSPWTENGFPVFFAGCDDGAVLRVSRDASGRFVARDIWVGTRGVRGVAADVFGADPAQETVAVFGYGREIVMLERTQGGTFGATTVFTDREKGHWLCAGELDDRNSTRELVACGFGGRVVVLSRTPGFGVATPVSPAAPAEKDP